MLTVFVPRTLTVVAITIGLSSMCTYDPAVAQVTVNDSSALPPIGAISTTPVVIPDPAWGVHATAFVIATLLAMEPSAHDVPEHPGPLANAMAPLPDVIEPTSSGEVVA